MMRKSERERGKERQGKRGLKKAREEERERERKKERKKERKRERESVYPIKLIIFHGRESTDVTSFNLLKITCSTQLAQQKRFDRKPDILSIQYVDKISSSINNTTC
jgi:hypothetical protein